MISFPDDEGAAGGATRFRDVLRNLIGERAFEVWFETLEVTVDRPGDAPTRLSLEATGSFQESWIRRHFGGELQRAACRVWGKDLELRLGSSDTETSRLETRESAPWETPNHQLRLHDFVLSEPNRLARAAVSSVLESPASIYNPLFVQGGAGVGKTSLLTALRNEWEDRRRGPALLMGAEAFGALLSESLGVATDRGAPSGQRATDLRRQLAEMRLLIIEDLDYFPPRPRLRERLGEVLEEAVGSGRQVVLSARVLPGELSRLGQALENKLQGGLIVSLGKPDRTALRRILGREATRRDLDLPWTVAEALVEEVEAAEGGPSELLAALQQLVARCRLERLPPDPSLARDCARGTRRSSSSACRPEDVLDVICRHFELSGRRLASKSKERRLTYPRQLGMHLMRSRTELSLERIGEHFGGRDHTTVLYALRVVKKALEQSDDRLIEDLELLESLLDQRT